MPADFMLVTPSSSLGDSVRRALEDTKFYRVHVVNNKATAIVKANEVGVPIAMLDLALGDEWVLEIGTALRTIRSSINLILLCEETGSPPSFDALRPWIMVRKPFRTSDFMNAISQPQPKPSASSPAPASSNTIQFMPWLSDPNKAAQHLTRLTLESSAQAALITKKSDLWAYAGGLSQNAAKEVAQTVTRNWDGQKGSDLLRFIRLESTKAEHMLYATRLTSDSVLALVFDAETPFSTIRSQAGQLLNEFGNDRSESRNQAPAYTSDMEDGDDLNIPPIANILADIPTPNPEPLTTHDFNLPRKQQETFDPNQTRVSDSLSNAAVFSREPAPAAARIKAQHPAAQVKQSPPSNTAFDEVEVTAPSIPKARPETPVSKPRPGENDSTRESPSTEAARKLNSEPISAGLYHLTYACLLVPRFSSHYLTGDLSDQLSDWLPNICVAFGWRLEFLAVRPEYLQWVVNVQPNTSPGHLMRIMRQQTSEKIFAEFPRMKRENPSGDFWAPGYLIMGGSQPHPPQLVRDYIRQTRQRQGLDDMPPVSR
ncbi:MAG: transposase [Anaerolineales bacterium]|uniref:transposase n=1 Tax=Candidatus Villigracilis vicinus TaxID=3140679 RepID=UPI0031356C25|nr:transposase [Anaerolineales bacterium]